MKKISRAILALITVLSACKKVPEVNLKYVDVERDLITVGTTTATVQCDYQYIATLKNAYLYYGEGQEETDMNKAEMRVVQNTLYVDLVGLRENTTYGYYYEFHNGFNSMRTAVKTFKTEASPTTITVPTVVTASVTEITTNSAKGGGEVTNDGGAVVTERGICWSTNANPTLSDSHVAAGAGAGAYTAMMNGLEASTTYHVRAFATNEKGTAYGLDREFVTIGGGGSSVPEGAINGLFTINENGDQVYFSQGNLQYNIISQTWSFMEHQYDIAEIDQQNVGDNYSNQNVVSLFGWGTSGFNHGGNAYQPWKTSTIYSDYYAYGQYNNNLYDQTGLADWGYNAIANGGNMENSGWRTLTQDEWNYLANMRSTTSGIRWVRGSVNGVNGIIFLPDNWIAAIYTLNNTNIGNYESNIIAATDWTNILEANGAVFLPAAGLRGPNANIYGVGVCGDYWSSSYSDDRFAYSVGSDNDSFNYKDAYSGREGGLSVRLVQDANP